MTQFNYRIGALLCAAGIASSGHIAAAQTVVVDSGQVLTRDHLDTWNFNGQAFVLGEDAVFEILDGGAVSAISGDEPASGPVPHYDLQGTTFNIRDGGIFHSRLSDPSRVKNVVLNLYEGGEFGSQSRISGDSEVNVLGGILRWSPTFGENVDFNITSGTASGEFNVTSLATISGGSISSRFGLHAGAIADISGGEIGPEFSAGALSTVNLYVRSLSIEGEEIELVPNERFVITARESKELVAILLDGSLFDYNLHTIHVPDDDSIAFTTLLTATLIIDCPADVNGDGAVSPADFAAWINAFNTNSHGCDQNFDGNCTPSDFSAWIANFNTGCV